ncbi:MAG: PP2C family protein-serine/threonine phosphatase [Cyclobacteriaceae bacterium]
MIYELAFDTFIGARSENQDSILNLKITEDVFLVGIADGMGGMAGGKLASALAVGSVREYIENLPLDQFKAENLKTILAACCEAAGSSIKKAKASQPEYHGMGTTLSLLLICGDVYVWSNIGDSRIYEIENEGINLITVDHTLVQQLSEEVQSELEESVSMKYDHLLTKCLDGSGASADIFPLEDDYKHADDEITFLLCSDGLLIDRSASHQSNLLKLITKNDSVQNAVSTLISYAYSQGSKDNISVGLVRILEGSHERVDNRDRNEESRRQIYHWLIYFVLFLFAVISGSVFISSRDTRGNEFESKTGIGIEPAEKIVKTKWFPLNKREFINPIKVGSDIYWVPYPAREEVRYYHIVIMSENDVLLEKYLSDGQTYLSMEELDLKSNVVYTLIVDAILIKNIRIQGNSVQFTLEEES